MYTYLPLGPQSKLLTKIYWHLHLTADMHRSHVAAVGRDSGSELPYLPSFDRVHGEWGSKRQGGIQADAFNLLIPTRHFI